MKTYETLKVSYFSIWIYIWNNWYPFFALPWKTTMKYRYETCLWQQWNYMKNTFSFLLYNEMIWMYMKKNFSMLLMIIRVVGSRRWSLARVPAPRLAFGPSWWPNPFCFGHSDLSWHPSSEFPQPFIDLLQLIAISLPRLRVCLPIRELRPLKSSQAVGNRWRRTSMNKAGNQGSPAKHVAEKSNVQDRVLWWIRPWFV